MQAGLFHIKYSIGVAQHISIGQIVDSRELNHFKKLLSAHVIQPDP